MNVNYISSPS